MSPAGLAIVPPSTTRNPNSMPKSLIPGGDKNTVDEGPIVPGTAPPPTVHVFTPISDQKTGLLMTIPLPDKTQLIAKIQCIGRRKSIWRIFGHKIMLFPLW